MKRCQPRHGHHPFSLPSSLKNFNPSPISDVSLHPSHFSSLIFTTSHQSRAAKCNFHLSSLRRCCVEVVWPNQTSIHYPLEECQPQYVPIYHSLHKCISQGKGTYKTRAVCVVDV